VNHENTNDDEMVSRNLTLSLNLAWKSTTLLWR